VVVGVILMVLHLKGSNLLEGIYLSIGLLLEQQCLSGINLFVEGVFLPFEIGMKERNFFLETTKPFCCVV